MDADEAWLAAVFEQVGPHLDERQRRLLAGAHARALGHGGIATVSRACGMRQQTVSRGVRELDAGGEPWGRVRAPGAGRKRLAEIEQLIVPYTAHHEAELHAQRGGPSRRKPAGGHPPALTLPEMLLITVLSFPH